MPVIISYNHSDKDFAETLATNLVQAKLNVWIDKWELNAGDSLIERIQGALSDADAILVLLSKNSTQSEWCKKELRTGLMRELEEKSVLVIPLVLDDCEIPLFLKEKLWIDFRKDKDEQLSFLIRSLARVSNPAQARAETPDYHLDWSMSTVSFENEFGVEWTFVSHGEKLPYVVMTQVAFWPKNGAAEAFASMKSDDQRHAYVARSMRSMIDEVDDFRIVLSSPEPHIETHRWQDNLSGGHIDVTVSTRRMGMDTGMDTLVDVKMGLEKATSHTLSVLQ